jgi:hypothetical protein
MNALKLIRNSPSLLPPANQPFNRPGSKILVVSDPHPKIMKKLTASIALLSLMALAATKALAALSAYESFNYSTVGQTQPPPLAPPPRPTAAAMPGFGLLEVARAPA